MCFQVKESSLQAQRYMFLIRMAGFAIVYQEAMFFYLTLPTNFQYYDYFANMEIGF